jgi:two-component system chemotaxis response regulator CheB
MNVAATTSGQALAREPLRVMVVDDAIVVRGLVSHWVESEPDLTVVALLRTGREAVDQLAKSNPDVVILDIDMPVLDGLSALPLLLAQKPDLVVIMSSTLTRRNAEISFRALSFGAADYLPKPESSREFASSTSFRRELIEKIRQLGMRKRNALARIPGRVAEPRPTTRPQTKEVKLRPFSPIVPRVLLIGCSTGGPQALNTLLPMLPNVTARVPVLITQHMPPTFTTILAEHIARATGKPASEAAEGESVVPGHIYIAPGGRHMRVVGRPGGTAIALDEGPLINYCRPAVDPLFSTAVKIWGSSTMALILTGMGADGTQGAAEIVGGGGSVIAQDEASSVVWGMPGSAAQAGYCSAVLPLPEMATKVEALFQRKFQ